MQQANNSDAGGFDPINQPMIRLQATLEPVAHQPSENGSTNGAAPHHIRSTSSLQIATQKQDESTETLTLIESVLARPRMYCAEVASVRELLMIVQGIDIARCPPVGICLADFVSFACKRLRPTATSHSIEMLAEAYANKPFIDASRDLFALFREWDGSQMLEK